MTVLFGSILGLSSGAARVAAAVGLGVFLSVVAVARPLLFASLDEAVAAAAGVPVRALGILFLALVGVTAAATTQAVGALLLLGLLAVPAAAAHRITPRPFLGIALSTGLAVGALWAGLVLSYKFPSIPPSFAIVAVAVAVYALSFAGPLVIPARMAGSGGQRTRDDPLTTEGQTELRRA